MPSYNPPIRDIQFVLHEVLGAETLSKLEGMRTYQVIYWIRLSKKAASSARKFYSLKLKRRSGRV